MAQESEREAPTSHEAEEHGLPPPRERVIPKALGHSPQGLHLEYHRTDVLGVSRGGWCSTMAENHCGWN